ncbi:hypothetical protein CVT24_006774 [Panaeolus cyanescens]|uniref:Uncharacterized protein n=1 Tax=Panaeolus cyanescens TaxID=181874 RepID=A0A409VBK5_9AGAR|nr:hypothetical protein CVT24_006774 [Panaeolus cyanescens]
MYRGPSRLLWFTIGAITASCYIKRKEERRHMLAGHCRRPPLGPNDLPQVESSTEDQDPWRARAAGFSRTINNLNADEVPATSPWDDKEFQQQKEHFVKVTRQAGEAMSDLTENTLEAVISAAQAMRLKLADSRKRRELEEELRRRQSIPQEPQDHISDDSRKAPPSDHLV